MKKYHFYFIFLFLSVFFMDTYGHKKVDGFKIKHKSDLSDPKRTTVCFPHISEGIGIVAVSNGTMVDRIELIVDSKKNIIKGKIVNGKLSEIAVAGYPLTDEHNVLKASQYKKTIKNAGSTKLTFYTL